MHWVIGESCWNSRSVFRLLAALSLSSLLWWSGITSAAPMTAGNAKKLAQAWVAANPKPMGAQLGREIESVETFTDANSQPLYYVVYLRPNGFVIVPADDEIEPVICFAKAGCFDPSPDNPLGALVSRDLPGRVNAARTIQKMVRSGKAIQSFTQQEMDMRHSGEKAFAKWSKLLNTADSCSVLAMSSGSISDVRVSPLLQSEWSQTTTCSSNACYNYYTPPNSSGNSSNYPCGCVATAMAQYMRFWQYPTTGVGTGRFIIYVNDMSHSQYANLRGGNGSGGPYDWNDMTLVPDCSTTLTQRQAIGALTYDAGVAVNMEYTSSGSGAYMNYADAAMTSTFHYSNSIYGYNNNNTVSTAALSTMLNPNLDWGNPVILGISGPGAGHAVVADGYGYDSSTLYHHLNLGWAGNSDAWYNLPNIGTSYDFNVVDSTIYNIYMSGSGEIISGRVTITGSGSPISGATVTATKSGGGTYSAVTNSNGIYAIAKIPSKSSYTVSVAKTGYSFTSRQASTGKSQDNSATSGNCWGIDFNGIQLQTAPAATDSNVSVSAGTSQVITLQATDDNLPNPPGALTYIITSLPKYGTLSDPCAGQINTVPYSLVNYGNDVNYTSRICYTGDVNFHFKANDGGTPPNGGDSNIATVSINVQQPAPSIIYETDFDTGLPTGWTIVHGGSGSPTDTWRSDNPAGRTSPYWTGTFMIVDSNYAGPVDMNEQLITQNINCTNLTGVKLRFEHDFEYYAAEIGDVDILVNGGAWQNMARYQGADYAGLVELNLSGFGADGAANVQIRWHYYNANRDLYWGIDNVQIIAAPAAAAPPGDFNFDCEVDYDDLAIFADAWLSSTGQANWNANCDISPSADGIINELDFAVFAQNWLVNVN